MQKQINEVSKDKHDASLAVFLLFLHKKIYSKDVKYIWLAQHFENVPVWVFKDVRKLLEDYHIRIALPGLRTTYFLNDL